MNPARGRTALRGLVIALALGLLATPFLAPLDRLAFDGWTRLLRRTEDPRPQAVALVGIDEGTYQAFPEPFALWHRHLAAVFQGLALARPQAVGVDLALPERSQEALVPGADAALLGGILRLRQQCPLVVGLTVDAAGRTRLPFGPFLAGLGGEEGLGYVEFEPDPDGTVRRFTEHFHGSPRPSPTLAGQLARRLGLPVREGLLDYREGTALPSIPFQQVEAWAQTGDVPALRQAFGGKVVLVGGVLPLEDRLRQVVDLMGPGGPGPAPGVLLHVQAMRNLLGRGCIRPVALGWRVLLALLLAGLGWGLARRPASGGAVLAGVLGLGVAALAAFQAGGTFLGPALPVAGLLAAYGGRTLAGVQDRLRERRRLRATFGGYVSPAILSSILAGRVKPGLQGETVRLCVLFSDVRGFTTLSEGRPPEEVITLLNRYFERMTPCIHAQGGTVDKFMGDGLMAHFGHPAGLQNPARAGFEAAGAMLEALAGLNRELAREGRPALQIGIGLHLGEAVVGHLGSRERHEYTAVGDTVNLASRLEGLTREAGFPLLVTAPVAEALGPGVPLEPLGERPIKGHSPIPVFGWKPHPPGGPDR